MAEVPRRVVGLLERAQDERGERPAAVAGAAHVLVDQHAHSATMSAACDGVSGSGTGGVATSSDASWATRRLTACASGRSWTR